MESPQIGRFALAEKFGRPVILSEAKNLLIGRRRFGMKSPAMPGQ